MLTCFSLVVSLFLVVLGLAAISIGVRTYMHLNAVRLVVDGGDVSSNSSVFLFEGLTEGDLPPSLPSRPFYTLAFITIIGLLPLSFGILMFVKMIGIF